MLTSSSPPHVRWSDHRWNALVTTIILINGPPRSGKDMAATFIRRDLGADRCTDFRMKQPLWDIFQAMFAFTDMQLHNMVNTPQKDMPQEMLHGLTPRQVLIDISESFIKPRFGDQFLGEVIARRIANSPCEFATVSDSGFTTEAWPLLSKFQRPNIFCISLSREGTSFGGDSRSYIDCDALGIRHVRIKNDHDLDMYRIQLRRALKWIPRIQELLEG